MAVFRRAEKIIELNEGINKLMDKIRINKDLEEFLEEQKVNDRYELGYYPMIYRTVPRDSAEYRQLWKKERKLRKSLEYANKTIRKMIEETRRMSQKIRQLKNEIRNL